MFRKALGIGVVICFGFATSEAIAGEAGVYVGLAGGVAYSNATQKAEEGLNYTVTTKKDLSRPGSKAYGGYSWGNWAVEGGYYDFGKYSIAGNAGGLTLAAIMGIPSEDQIGIAAVGISAARNFPLSKEWSLVGKFGLASATTKYHCVSACGVNVVDQSATSVVPFAGFGGKWSPLTNISFRADWEAMSGINAKFHSNEKKISVVLVSVGVEAHF